MARTKTDSFFIRQELEIGGVGAWENVEVPLGSFVDALGEVVLRIHEVRVKYQTTSSNGPPSPVMTNPGSGYIAYGLTTQPYDSNDTPTLDNRAVIASGQLVYFIGNGGVTATGNNYVSINDVTDVSPEDWGDDGYLVGVDAIYLNGFQDAEMGTGNTISICMRCTSEKLTKGAAMSLALSQQ